MFIDKKGKLFGKINIIDFLILLVLVVAIAVVGIKVMKKDVIMGDSQTLEMQFYIEEVDGWVAENVKVGDTLHDGTYDQNLGKVTDVEIGEAKTWGLNAEGQYVLSTRKDANGEDLFVSMIITGEVKGTKTEVGAEVDGKRYGVGHSMVLYAGDAKLYLRIKDITVKE